MRRKKNPSAELFVDAVYRRMLIVRAVEQMGRGMLLASLLACGLVLLADWQSMPASPVLLFCGLFGAVVGMILMFRRGPTRRWAAIEADRQLGFDDLLISAVYPAAGSDIGFDSVVRLMADARCKMHSPSELLLRKLGLRSWSGIALATCVAVTLAVIPLAPSRSPAIDINATILSGNPPDLGKSMQPAREATPIASDPMSQGDSNAQMSSVKRDQQAPTGSDAPRASAVPAAGSLSGIGAGTSTTSTEFHRPPPAGKSVGRTAESAGIAASGGAASSQHDQHGDSPAGSLGASTQARGRSSVSDKGSRESTQIGSDTDDRIPTEDRDLIRDFFQR